MDLLVSYDVSTETRAGRRRLRRVANVCLSYGQRVQKSVFECTVNEKQLLVMERRLVAEIDLQADSLRIYRLREPRQRNVTVYGLDTYRDLSEPLIF